MIETLVAVLVLGLVVTASLKLVALSNRGLAEAREREFLLREAGKLQISVAVNPAGSFGASGDIIWSVSEKSSPMFADADIDIAAMVFSDEPNRVSGYVEKNWKEIEVTRNGKSVTMFLPRPSENVSSGDSR
jgi:Tfp pilus assembly protein PilV